MNFCVNMLKPGSKIMPPNILALHDFVWLRGPKLNSQTIWQGVDFQKVKSQTADVCSWSFDFSCLEVILIPWSPPKNIFDRLILLILVTNASTWDIQQRYHNTYL